jgi:hypothetical protein
MAAHEQGRYVVQVEIRPASDPNQLTEDDLSEDNLEKISKMLNAADHSETSFDAGLPVRTRFDLCSACRDRYLKSPFSCQPAPKLNFSEN